jgi:zinc ribbon protein
MHCTSCGVALPTDARFCPACGSAVTQVKQSDLFVAAEVPSPPRRPNKKRSNVFLVGCLVSVGIIVLIAIGVALQPNSSGSPVAVSTHTRAPVVRTNAKPKERPAYEPTRQPTQQPTEQPTPQPTEQSTPDADPCESATQFEKKAVAAVNAGDYEQAYDYAGQGIDENGGCDDDNSSLVNSGYLLSMKGLAEHYLPQGDSRTDLNQANQLLVECQTNPDLYGTATAAGCETQEQNNISAMTNWEMNQ